MLLKDKLKTKKLILASHSPRRKELISGTGLEFTLSDGYSVDEVYPDSLPAEDVAWYLAGLKSEGYPHALGPGEILITADTVVISGDKVLGKPESRKQALDMLSMLSSRKHTVVTGVVIRDAGRKRVFSVATDVWFRQMGAEEMEYYVDTYKPYDKAGAYGIQEWIGYVAIERIEGSFYNVMGLPVQTLYVELDKFADTR